MADEETVVPNETPAPVEDKPVVETPAPDSEAPTNDAPVNSEVNADAPKPDAKPEGEPKPDDEKPAGPRDLRSIYEDYQANKPLPPSEMAQLTAWADQARKAEEDAKARAEAVRNAFPNAQKSLIENLTELGLDLNDPLRKELVETRFGKVFEDLQTNAEDAVLQPYIDTQFGQLTSLAGGDRQILERLATLPAEQYIPAARALGERAGYQKGLKEAMEGKAFQEKLDAGIEAARKEWEAANPERVAGKLGDRAFGGSLTREKYLSMSPDERLRLWDENPEAVAALK